MRKKILASLLALTFVLSVFASASALAFGELENTIYQKVEYDWFKGFFGNLFSLTPTGCTEKYETSVTTAQMTQSQFPITIKCLTGYNIGTPVGNYYCQVLVLPVRNDGYSYTPNEKYYIDIPVGGSKVIYWWNYNGFPSDAYGTGIDYPYNIVGTRTITNYKSWSCPAAPACTPNAVTDAKCVSDSAGTFTVCRSQGDYTIPGTLICPTNYKCSSSGANSVPSCVYSPPACVANWQCGTWDVCKSNSQQTRTCSDGCGNTKTESGACNYVPSCTQVYNCGSWSACQSNNQQTRTCTVDSCGKTTTETGACNYVPSCQNIQSQPPCASDETKTVTSAAYTDSSGCYHPEVFTCAKNGGTTDNNTTAMLAIGGLSAVLAGLIWFIRKKK